MSVQASLKERLRYRVDSFLGKGSGALFIALVVAFLVSLAIISVLRWVFVGVESLSPTGEFPWVARILRGIWTTWLELTDPGNMNQDNDTFWLYKVPAIVAGLTGVVIFSALIAFLGAALQEAIENLKKGHSRVLETGHTLIIGWGPRVPEILRELVLANESEGDAVAVVLSEEEKVAMDEHLRQVWTDRRNTRLVTRNGATSSLAALERVNARGARSAIVLATCAVGATSDDKLSSDAKVIKTVLALIAHVGEDHEMNIVAEVFEPRNRKVVKDIAPERITVVDAEEILARIMVQTSRTSGLSVVYSELLSFDGCELYFHKAAWGGITFGELAFRFPDGVALGVRQADGTLLMRADPGYVMQEDDEILIVAEDDSTIQFQAAPVVQPRALPIRDARITPEKERMLILGWSQKAPILIREYSDYVLEGSEVKVMLPGASLEVHAKVTELNEELENARCHLVDRDPLDVEDLSAVDPFSYNVVIILPQKPDEEPSPERVDAETIIVLLHLRKLQRQAVEAGRKVDTRIITEVLDSSNQELITRAGVNDFIISNRMVSMIFAQLSEHPDILQVYDNLFQEDGSEIYVKPAWLYFDKLPVTCRFGDLMATVRQRDTEICLGIKLKAHENDARKNFGVKLIPTKDTEITLGAQDGLVVLAEDDM